MENIMIPISPGELIDKLTILEIKLQEIKDHDKLKNIEIEYNFLTDIVNQTVGDRNNINKLRDDLKKVNIALWNIEDDIRACERSNDFGDRFIELARSVYINNDTRAVIKKNINTELGSLLVEEKSYEKY